jgi:dTDP-4-amino-4,6-dideoxygalactose transaminase
MITKSPVDKTSFIKPLIFTNAARAAFNHVLQNLSTKINVRILLPSYIGITDREGSGVLDPIISNNILFEFYTLDKQLNADINDLNQKLKTGNYNVLLVIHYFGFVQKNIEYIAKVCKEKNIILIEDCAHALVSKYQGSYAGDFGDFSFFSFHKYLASTDGGMLKINNKTFNLTSLPIKFQIENTTLSIFYTSDYNRIAEKRIANYLYLKKGIEDIGQLEILFPNIEMGTVPMNLPVIINNGKREELYFYLMDIEIPTIALYYRLIPQINKDQYPVSIFLSKNILNLPIHQDIEESDLDTLIIALKRFL